MWGITRPNSYSEKTPGVPGHTRDTRAHTGTRITVRRTSQPSKPTDTRRTTTRRPNPRPTQQPLTGKNFQNWKRTLEIGFNWVGVRGLRKTMPIELRKTKVAHNYGTGARFHFADGLRAGAGRRSGSGRRPGRVRWGRPLLSRPRGAFCSGAAGAAAEVRLLSRPRIRLSRGGRGCFGGFGWS